MDENVPYMPAVKNLSKILDGIQNASAPDGFGGDFLKDLGFTSSNDRAIIKLLKYIGLLDSSGKPQNSYREFMDQTKGGSVLASAIKSSYDDLFVAHKNAQTKTVQELKGWFKTKTGAGDASAEKMASTFKSLCDKADFTKSIAPAASDVEPPLKPLEADIHNEKEKINNELSNKGMNLVYRLEIHLPDTTNVETYRSIFRALREELY